MAATEERLVGGRAGHLLLTVSLGWLAIQGGRLVLSPLVPDVSRGLGVSPFLVGFAFTVLWGLYALMQYPSGRLSDALSRKTLLLAGLVVCVFGFAILAVAPSYPVFLLGAAVVGLGAGFYPTAARALVSDLFVAKRGRAFGLHTGSGDLGGVLAAGLAALVSAIGIVTVHRSWGELSVPPWRLAFFPSVAVLGVVALAYATLSREPFVVARRDLAVVDTARRLLTASRTRWLLLAYCFYAFTWQATASFLPTYLELGKGFDPLVAKAGFALLFGVGTLAKPAAGAVSDRIPRDVLAAAVLVLAAVALAGIVVSPGPVVALAAVTVFASGLLSFPPVMQSYLMDTFPADSAGGDLGAIRTVYIGIGSLGATYVGGVAGVASYAFAFAILVPLLLLAAGLVAWIGRRARRT